MRPATPAPRPHAPHVCPRAHLWVQRLHAAVLDLGESRVLRHILHGEARVAQRLGGAASGQQLPRKVTRSSGQRRNRTINAVEDVLALSNSLAEGADTASRKLRPIVVQPVLHGQKGLAWYQ